MKIEDKRKAAGKVRFGDLMPCEVFAYEGGDIGIKCAFRLECEGVTYNAFDPTDGLHWTFDDDDLVTPLPSARLVIE